MTNHRSTYDARISTASGAEYAAAVERFRIGMMKDCGLDSDTAFKRAVDTCERLIPAIKMKAARA